MTRRRAITYTTRTSLKARTKTKYILARLFVARTIPLNSNIKGWVGEDLSGIEGELMDTSLGCELVSKLDTGTQEGLVYGNLPVSSNPNPYKIASDCG